MKKLISFITVLFMALLVKAQVTETYEFNAWATNASSDFTTVYTDTKVTNVDGVSLTVLDYFYKNDIKYSLNGRLATNGSSSQFWLRFKQNYPKNTGLYIGKAGISFSILNLLPGDKLTFTIYSGAGAPYFLSSNVYLASDESKTLVEANTDIQTEVTYVVSGEEGSKVQVDLKGDTYDCIYKLVIETSASETISSPECNLTGANNGERTVTITPGLGSVGTESESTYYTIDGTDPSRENGTLYAEPFVVNQTTTIKAISYLPDGTASEITTFVAEAGTTLPLNTDIVKVIALAGENKAPKVDVIYTSEGVIGTPEATIVCTFNGKVVSLPYTVTENGTLVATASAEGYESTTETLELYAAYQVDRSIDLAGLEVTSENVATVLGENWIYQENKRWSGWENYNENGTAYVYPNAYLAGNYTFGGILSGPGSPNIPLRLLVGFGIGRERTETYTIADPAEDEIALFVVDESLNYADKANLKAVEYVSAYADDTKMSFTVNGAAAIAKVSVYTPVRELVINDQAIECDDFAPEYSYYTSAVYNRELKSDGHKYGLICLPFAPDAESLANFQFYALVNADNEGVTFEEVEAPEANTPYLYSVKDGATCTNQITGGAVSFEEVENAKDAAKNVQTDAGWTLVGSLKNQTITCTESDNNYYFNPQQNTLHKVTKTLTVYPYTAYFKAPQSDAGNGTVAQTMRVRISGPTGIKEISRDQVEGLDGKNGMFDLQGRSISQPVKGQVYIENGEKKIKN